MTKVECQERCFPPHGGCVLRGAEGCPWAEHAAQVRAQITRKDYDYQAYQGAPEALVEKIFEFNAQFKECANPNTEV